MILDFDYIPELEIRNPYMELSNGVTISNPLLLTTSEIYPKFGKIAIKDSSGEWIKDGFLPERSIVRFFIKRKKTFILQQAALDNLYIAFKMSSLKVYFTEAICLNNSIWVYENIIESKLDFEYILNLPITQLTAKSIESYMIYNFKTHLPEFEQEELKPEIKTIMSLRNLFINNGATENEKKVAKKMYRNKIIKLSQHWESKIT